MRTRMVGAALCLLLVAACGSSSKKASTDVSAKTDTNVAANVFTSSKCVATAKAMADVASKVPQAVTGQAGDINTAIQQFKAAADASPSEIRADMRVVADAYATFATALADADIKAGSTPSPEAMAKLETASKSLNAEEFTAAAQRVSTWFQTKCGK